MSFCSPLISIPISFTLKVIVVNVIFLSNVSSHFHSNSNCIAMQLPFCNFSLDIFCSLPLSHMIQFVCFGPQILFLSIPNPPLFNYIHFFLSQPFLISLILLTSSTFSPPFFLTFSPLFLFPFSRRQSSTSTNNSAITPSHNPTLRNRFSIA